MTFTTTNPAVGRRRGGFTLIELMLVLSVLVAFVALAWPTITRAYESSRLKGAAEQIQAAFGHARIQAMTNGVAQVFRFEPQTPQYTVSALQDGTEATESDDNSASTSSVTITPAAGAASATATSTMSSNDSGGGCNYQLPDGYAFIEGNRVLDARAAVSESEISGDGSSTTTPPILFYPDGTTSEATVTIGNQYGGRISVSLRGLTGVARMSDVFSGEPAQ